MKNKNWVKPCDIFVLEAKGGGVFHAVGPADAPPTLPEGGGGIEKLLAVSVSQPSQRSQPFCTLTITTVSAIPTQTTNNCPNHSLHQPIQLSQTF